MTNPDISDFAPSTALAICVAIPKSTLSKRSLVTGSVGIGIGVVAAMIAGGNNVSYWNTDGLETCSATMHKCLHWIARVARACEQLIFRDSHGRGSASSA